MIVYFNTLTRPQPDPILKKPTPYALLVAATIVLSSTASAAENQGDRLGEFLRVGVYEGRPFYKQRDTLGRTNTFLYSEGDKWVVREDLP